MRAHRRADAHWRCRPCARCPTDDTGPPVTPAGQHLAAASARPPPAPARPAASARRGGRPPAVPSLFIHQPSTEGSVMHALVTQSASIVDRPLDVLTNFLAVIALAAVAGVAAAVALRARGLRWDWTLLGLGTAVALHGMAAELGMLAILAGVVATVTALRWHAADLRGGGDLAAQAAARLGVSDAVRAWMARRAALCSPEHSWIDAR